MQLVIVEWDDAWADTDSFSTLHGVQQTHRPMVIKTLGWVLQDDALGISLANESSKDEGGLDTYRGRTFVPRAMIRSVTPFNLAKLRKKSAAAVERRQSPDPEAQK